jgi:hypothetical protein
MQSLCDSAPVAVIGPVVEVKPFHVWSKTGHSSFVLPL